MLFFNLLNENRLNESENRPKGTTVYNKIFTSENSEFRNITADELGRFLFDCFRKQCKCDQVHDERRQLN